MPDQVNEKRLVDRFLQLVQINSPSADEGGIVDYLNKMLPDLGFELEEDNAGRQLQQMLGDMKRAEAIRIAGNLIARKKGNQQQAVPILFAAHMDTVVPNQGVKPTIQDGVIQTDGTTILGADDKAGIAALLEAAAIIKEQNLPHGDLEFVFTIAEESGLYGSSLLDKQKLKAKFGFVMDSGGPPNVIIGASPTEVDFTIKIRGKAAHAGVNPEDGINAIAVLGPALSNLQLGRINEQTTVNIGIIKGGERTNIVCDFVELQGEVRSRDQAQLQQQIAKIQSAFVLAAENFGAKFEMQEQTIYSGFELTEADAVVKTAFKGAQKAGLSPQLAARGGGSDTNIFNAAEIPSVNLGVGAKDDHTNQESVRIQDLIDATKLVLGIIETVVEDAAAGAQI